MGKGLMGIAENVARSTQAHMDQLIVEGHVLAAKSSKDPMGYFRSRINKGRPDISKKWNKKKKKTEALQSWMKEQLLLRQGLVSMINGGM